MSQKGAKSKSVSNKKVIKTQKPCDDRFWIFDKPVDESYFEKMRNPKLGHVKEEEKYARNRNSGKTQNFH
jgi:hypothetical protein